MKCGKHVYIVFEPASYVGFSFQIVDEYRVLAVFARKKEAIKMVEFDNQRFYETWELE
jgi:hypothetical protein